MTKKVLLLGAAAVAASAGIALWWLAPRGGEEPAKLAAAEASSATGTLAVDGQRAAQMGIRLTPAVAAQTTPLATIPAIIQPPANARVAVAATVPGVVTRTLVVEGDQVKAGQALAVISSREVVTMGAELTRANARLGVAQANAARLTQLSQEGVVAGARADEANALAAEARADVSEKTRALRMVNGRGEAGSYTLTAPIAGRVTTAAIQAGNPVDGASAPYVIDAADRYEVVGQIPERLMGLVRPGMPVRLSPDIEGRIVAVGTTLDPATRSATVKAQIPARPGVVAGRATTILVSGPASQGAVAVPEAAVTEIEGRAVVFVTAPGGYAIRPVTRAGTSDGQVIVSAGLKAGEQVVTTGASALKALAASQ